jgi:hypothetical protein
MSWLNNFKIVFKISLIVALMAIVTIGTAVFATSRMRAMDDANTDMVSRVGKATTMAVRTNRRIEAFVSAAFQLAAETTDAGNVKFLALTVSSRNDYEARMAQVVKELPEKSAVLQPVIAAAQKAFDACGPAIQFAAKTSSAEDSLKAATRLKAECVPLAEAAVAAQGTMVDGLLADSDKASDQMTVDANSSIRSIFVASGVGLVAGLAIALWIGIKGLARPIGDLKTVMEAFARNELKRRSLVSSAATRLARWPAPSKYSRPTQSRLSV